jgi:hypothetical protein
VEWNEQGFISTDGASHRVIASQGFSHRTNRKAHFFIQPSLAVFDHIICLMLIWLHLEYPPVLLIHGSRGLMRRGMIAFGCRVRGLRYERGT